MKLLVLGGIAESRELAAQLHGAGHDVTYSIAGLVRVPDLPCEVISGGFSCADTSGTRGLETWCREHAVELLIDATHPYASDMSHNAARAANLVGIPCWRLDRPGWDSTRYPNWHSIGRIEELENVIGDFSRPFWSIGSSALQYTAMRQPQQQWIVRSARPFDDQPGIIQLNAIGPFSLVDELALMKKFAVDALISKDSGCTRVLAKMDAARELGIPAYVLKRPELPDVARNFTHPDDILAVIETFSRGQQEIE